jgi:protein SCO1/2
MGGSGVRRLAGALGPLLLAGLPSSASAQSVGVESTPASVAPAPLPVAMPASDEKAIVKRWGVRIEALQLTAAGYMLDFRYQVVDARKAKPLFERKSKPALTDEATGTVLAVPTPPKTGPLRSSYDPQAGRSYFMFFGNPGRLVREGQTATVTIGPFRVTGIPVTARVASAPTEAAPADPHAAHRAAAAAPPETKGSRVMPVQPVLEDVPLLDQAGRATTLRSVLDTEQPVLLNFIFTTCTTVCPIMTRGFAQLHEALGPERGRVRLVSISIDPEQDTVEALRRYGSRYGADDSWLLLTGSREASVSAQRAFGAYRGDKMSHAAATYVRRSRQSPWMVIDGLASGETLESVLREPDRTGDN